MVRGVDLEGIHSAMSAGDVAELKALQSQMSFQAEAAEAFSTSSVLCATTATDANENEVEHSNHFWLIGLLIRKIFSLLRSLGHCDWTGRAGGTYLSGG